MGEVFSYKALNPLFERLCCDPSVDGVERVQQDLQVQFVNLCKEVARVVWYFPVLHQEETDVPEKEK